MFISIGLTPQSDFVKDILNINKFGYIESNEGVTGVDGIFVAGDCRDKQVRQITVATSDGTVAAMSAINYLENNITNKQYQDEFYGISKSLINGELSNDVGVHQDATTFHVMGAEGGSHYIYASYTKEGADIAALPPNYDTCERHSKDYSMAGRKASAYDYINYKDDKHFSFYTSRPTNVAVLYCIKY